MSKIENLIKELCPEGVPMVKLGDVCEIKTGKGITQKDALEGGNFPIISGGVEPMGMYHSANRNANTLTISRVGANAGYVNYILVPFYLNDKCFSVIPIESGINTKYLFYITKSKEEDIKGLQSEGGVPTINTSKVASISIPLPPLDVQKEIVRILDKFATMVECLDKEIQLRQKQYEYYREKLLTFEEGECDWKTLGNIGSFVRGNGLQKADFRDDGFPCIHYGQIHTFYGTSTYTTKSFCEVELSKKLKKVPTGGLIIATTSEDVEACCKAVVWLGEGEVAYSGDSFGYIHNQNPKYMAYLFQTELFAKQKRKVATGAKVVRVSGESMAKFEFLFPPLARQQEIVDTLDKFEAMIAKLKEERALRLKQYEYYREKLLTF